MIKHTDQVSRLEKELEKVKDQRDDLAIKNITLERENVRLVGEINGIKEKIIQYCKTMEILEKLLISWRE